MNLTLRIQVAGAPGFHGELLNIDVSREPGIEHTNIDKSPALQTAVIEKIRAVVAEQAPPVAVPGAADANVPLAQPETAAPFPNFPARN